MNSNKIVLTVIAAVLAAFGLIVGAPAVAVPLLAIAVTLVILAQRNEQPIAAEAASWGQRWYVWLAVAAGLFLVGFSMLLTADDGELNTVAWAVWLLSWLAAAIVAVVGLGFGATRLVHHRRT